MRLQHDWLARTKRLNADNHAQFRCLAGAKVMEGTMRKHSGGNVDVNPMDQRILDLTIHNGFSASTASVLP